MQSDDTCLSMVPRARETPWALLQSGERSTELYCLHMSSIWRGAAAAAAALPSQCGWFPVL